MNPIKIIRFTRGYVLGQTYAGLDHGIRQTLIDCGRAVEVVPEVPAEPVMEEEVRTESVQPRRHGGKR